MTAETSMDKQKMALQQLANAFAVMPFNSILGLHLNDLNEDHVTMSFEMKKDLVGNFVHGILHGGVISSVLDMAGGMAAMASLIYLRKDADQSELAAMLGKTGTIDLHISYLRPGKGERFTAKAEVVHSGNRICFTKMALYNQDTLLIASGTGTYKLAD